MAGALEGAAAAGDIGPLEAAAVQGDARACQHLAVLLAVGVARPPDWPLALHWLQRAAELGALPAQRALHLLAAESSDQAPADWMQARRLIDLDRLLKLPARQPLCEQPRIRRFEGFASQAVCDWLIAGARNRLARARLYDAGSGGAVVHGTRTNTEADFDIVQTDIVLALLRARIAAAVGLPPAVMELSKVLHYAPGEAFAPHHDYIDPTAPGLADELRVRGQRLATFLLYLNDDYAGGETEFPRIGLRHKGRRGDALLFANVDPAGRPDPQTLHAGLAPLSGEKWLLSQWLRDRVPLQA